ncbi:MAG: ABC transporter substrate-binding protein [Spirochaetales bacterium]|nr:ABC transporter substrate-binding protein [Spirochaetales bacterium]
MKILKIFFLQAIISICIFTLLFSCGAKRDELVYFPNKNPNHLIPLLYTNEEAKYLCELIFDGLVNKNKVEDGKEDYQWALVTKEGGYREEDPFNRFVITLYLKKGVLWHDGREFTAEDVIFTWNAINNSDSSLKGWLNSFIEEMYQVEGNNYKIKVKLKVERSKEAFMELFSPVKIVPKWYMFNKKQCELPSQLNDKSDISEEFKFRPVGTGPYKIRTRGTQEKIVLTRNEQYHLLDETGKTNKINLIRMEVEKDPIKGIKELKDKLALIFDVNQEYFKQLENTPLHNMTYLPYSFYAIVFNTKRLPFNDEYFRKAVTRAIDKNDLLTTFLKITDFPDNLLINHGIFPNSSGYAQFKPDEFYDTNMFDPEDAKNYIKKSGIQNKTFRLLICSALDGEGAGKLAEGVKNMMRAIGVECEIDDFNIPLYNKRLNEYHYDAVFYQYKGFDHFYDIRSLFGNSDLNYWQVHNNELNDLLTLFGSTLDWEKLVAIAKQIHKKVNDITPACFLFTIPRRAYYSNNLANVSVHPEVGFSTIEEWELQQQ